MAANGEPNLIPESKDTATVTSQEIRGLPKSKSLNQPRHRSRSRNQDSEAGNSRPTRHATLPSKPPESPPKSLRIGLLATEDTEYNAHKAKREPPSSSKRVSRTKTLLRRLGTIKTPVAPVAGWRLSRHDAYTPLEGPDDEDVGVDISSLGGLGFQLRDMSQTKDADTEYLSPSSNERTEEDPGARNLRGALGDGMVVGAKLQLEEAPTVVTEETAGSVLRTLTVKEKLQRQKTIRDQALAVAKQKNAMVVVNDVVDLSSLGDSGRTNTNSSALSMDTSEPPRAKEQSQSYFFPEDADTPNWKPFSMRSLYIITLIVISLVLGSVQEWLYQLSASNARDNKGILSFDRVEDVSLINFFAWKYMPTLVFVTYGVFWSIMDYEIKRLEPYYQLSKRNGNVASQSLNLDHLTLWSYLVPFKAATFRQWAVFYSAVGNLLATSAAPALQNPALQLSRNGNCHPKNNEANCPSGEKLFFVSVDAVWSRLLTSSLILTAAFAAVVLYQLRRKSGLLSDPKGIAGIASMATKSHILQDFQGMDLATHRQIHKRLQDRRYLLYKSSIWQGEYGKRIDPYKPPEKGAENPHPLMLRIHTAVAFISFLIFCLIVIPIINFTPARALPRNASWLPILVATIIKMLWTTFEFDVRMMEPFYILSKGNAYSDETLTLDYQGTPYGWFPLKALLNGHYIPAIVGLGSILLDILTVTVSSFSVNGENNLQNSTLGNSETPKSFQTSVALSITIIVYCILSSTLVYVRRRHPFLPRQPSTIASILCFIYSSNMLYDFVDTERLSNAQMERRLQDKGKRYGLGWFKGLDGRMHVAVDEEPMRSAYVHGKPYTMAQAPWETGGGQEFV
ncbi:MAG: hypothetical protein Q9227_008145 [Pyrenula ochraceoflavens]